jgi:hypothetical protein
VRGWLRAARRRSEVLRGCGLRWAVALDPELGPVAPIERELAEAVNALAIAARAMKMRFGKGAAEPWELVVLMSGGALLRGSPRHPPGFGAPIECRAARRPRLKSG